MSPALLLALLVTAPVHRAALIIGVNEPFEATQAVLRYADDDAARYYELLAPELSQVALLTVLDADSQSIFPEVAQVAGAPDRVGLERALAQLDQGAQSAKDQGQRTELYFIYIGHGRAQGGEGEVRLLGSSLGRTALAATVLSDRVFDRIHVIVDACNAYHLINARGADAPVTKGFDEAFERFVEGQSLEHFPTVGVVLSTSGAGATHEWSRYQAGVFSHEVRSALTGAADADGDQQLSYLELEAFISAANLQIPELKGRPKVYVRPPAIETAAAIWAVPADRPGLALPPALVGHYFLEDDRGVRYADWNKAAGYQLAVSLVPRPRYGLYDAAGAERWSVEAPVGRLRLPEVLDPAQAARGARGEEGPPGAFAVPYGPAFVEGFRARLVPDLTAEAPEPAPVLRIAGFSAVGLALLAGAGSVWQGRAADAAYERYQSAGDQDELKAAGADVQSAQTLAWTFGITAGVSALLGAGLLTFDFLE